MKKQLFSLSEPVAEALDKKKADDGVDKSAFVDAVLARELGVELPEGSGQRQEILDQLTIKPQDPDLGKTSETTEPVPPAADEPATEPAPQAEVAPTNNSVANTAFESPAAAPGFVSESPADTGNLDELFGEKPATPTADPVVYESTDDIPIVEPVQASAVGAQTQEPNSSERVCPNCGEKYDTPYCLNCL